MDDYIQTHHLERVSFVGFHSDPWSLVTDKDILVLPARLETFSLVFVESVLNGVPAIISDNLGHLSSRDRKSTRLNSSHSDRSRMPSSA